MVLTSPRPLGATSLHACVLAAETRAQGGTNNQLKLRFSPPLETFDLVHFQNNTDFMLPFRGFYQLKSVSTNTVKLLLQLKLNDSFTNQLEYFSVTLPLPGRGRITEWDGVPTGGSVQLGAEAASLVWQIGKMPPKNNAISFQGIVHFTPSLPELTSKGKDVLGEPPWVNELGLGATAYAQLHFKILDGSGGTISIDPSTVVVLPAVVKPKISVGKFWGALISMVIQC